MAETKEQRKARSERAKQGRLQGMEPPHDKQIEAAADRYVDARDSRMSMLDEEIEAGKILLKLLKDKGLNGYEYNGKIISIAHLEKVKVKRAKAEENGEADE